PRSRIPERREFADCFEELLRPTRRMTVAARSAAMRRGRGDVSCLASRGCSSGGRMTLRSKYFGFLALGLALAVPVARAQASEAEQIQAALESWVAERASAEKVTGVAAYVSFGDPGPAIEAFAGKTGRDPQDPPARQNTLFQMGSTSKSFAAAVILKLGA